MMAQSLTFQPLAARVARAPRAAARRAAVCCAPAPGGEPAVEAEAAPAPPAPKKDNFDDFFAFKSWGPEIVNGRLAMLGFVSGAAAEITSGETTLSQFSAHHWAFVLAAVLFTAASFMPRFQGETTAKPESKENGMWKASTELLNGRAAMVGLSAMFVQEAITGNPVF